MDRPKNGRRRGGDAATITRLDSLFSQLNAGTTQPYFYMGDEPQFATPWLYAFAGAPYKTQNIVRQILTLLPPIKIGSTVYIAAL